MLRSQRIMLAPLSIVAYTYLINLFFNVWQMPSKGSYLQLGMIHIPLSEIFDLLTQESLGTIKVKIIRTMLETLNFIALLGDVVVIK